MVAGTVYLSEGKQEAGERVGELHEVGGERGVLVPHVEKREESLLRQLGSAVVVGEIRIDVEQTLGGEEQQDGEAQGEKQGEYGRQLRALLLWWRGEVFLPGVHALFLAVRNIERIVS